MIIPQVDLSDFEVLEPLFRRGFALDHSRIHPVLATAPVGRWTVITLFAETQAGPKYHTFLHQSGWPYIAVYSEQNSGHCFKLQNARRLIAKCFEEPSCKAVAFSGTELEMKQLTSNLHMVPRRVNLKSTEATYHALHTLLASPIISLPQVTPVPMEFD